MTSSLSSTNDLLSVAGGSLLLAGDLRQKTAMPGAMCNRRKERLIDTPHG
ncbi:MAG: hypothetical protein ACWGKN_12910 [Desulfoprunum sp.]